MTSTRAVETLCPQLGSVTAPVNVGSGGASGDGIRNGRRLPDPVTAPVTLVTTVPNSDDIGNALRCGDPWRDRIHGPCGRPILEGETAWRNPLDESNMLVWLCSDCCTFREFHDPPAPCEGGCGVLLAHWLGGQPTHATCSARCRRRVYRQRDPEPRGCETCGEPVTASRSDARYCSPACRQKAYRRRSRGPHRGDTMSGLVDDLHADQDDS